MCLAIPAQVVRVDATAEQADVMLGEVRKSISTALLESVEEGDFVLVHVGYALHVLDRAEAEETLRLMRQVGLVGAARAGVATS